MDTEDITLTEKLNFLNIDLNRDGLNDDGKHILKIIQGLERNFNKYGKTYCPCKIDKIDDNICPCKDYRETSKCICKLYKS